MLPSEILQPLELRLSPSQISCWAECHRKWWYRYVEKVKKPRPVAAVYGIEFHRLLEQVVRSRISADWQFPEISQEELASVFVANGDSPDSAAKAAEAAVWHVVEFCEKILPKLEPAGVEETWRLEVGEGLAYTARTDYRDARGFVVDYKFKNRITDNPFLQSAHDRLEVAMQVIASGATEGYLLLFDRGTKAKKVAKVKVAENSEALREQVVDLVEGAAKGIRAGDDAPNGAWCSSYGQPACLGCDYVDECIHGSPYKPFLRSKDSY